jgi:hypothetical protein
MHFIDVEIDNIVQRVADPLLFRHFATSESIVPQIACIIERNKNKSSRTGYTQLQLGRPSKSARTLLWQGKASPLAASAANGETPQAQSAEDDQPKDVYRVARLGCRRDRRPQQIGPERSDAVAERDADGQLATIFRAVGIGRSGSYPYASSAANDGFSIDVTTSPHPR